MYGHLIYFILILLIYSTYYPPEAPYFKAGEAGVLFFLLLCIFIVVTRRAFNRLLIKVKWRGPEGLHGQFDRLFARQAIMAIGLFAIDLYLLNLKGRVNDLPLFSHSPTLTAAFFIGLYAGYLAIIWTCAHEAYVYLFNSPISKRAYVFSNIRFHLPVVLPWLVISLGIDLVDVLPFDAPKRFLARPEGQLLFFAGFFVALAVVAPAMIKFFWQCRSLSPGHKRRQIEALCERARLGYRDILDWPIFEGRLLTAGVMGLVRKFRYILVTDGLLKILDDDELRAVMAHEIGHIKRRHLSFYLLFIFGFMVLSYTLFDLITYAVLYTSVELPISGLLSTRLPVTTSVVFTVLMAVFMFVYFRYIFGYFMRNCERQADLYAFSLLGDSRSLVSALEKVAAYSGQVRNRPSWHHFSISQRVAFLDQCEKDRRRIQRHDRKLWGSMSAFAAGLLLIGYVGYTTSFGEMGKTLNSHFFERALLAEIEKEPRNPKLHNALASLYYQQGAYERAIAFYERVIRLSSTNVEALNNLAWLYATCDDERYRKADKALLYARKAAQLRPAPHVLDTLAESYYANGKFSKAVEVIEEAVAREPAEKDYYRRQMRKFQRAARRESRG